MSSKMIDCIVVDDEPIARKIVIGFIAQMSHLNSVGQFKNAMEAILFLERRQQPTLVFLDINMPNLSGISMAKLLTPQHLVVFTTAYAEYAVESYEYDAVDYLLKPFTFDRFAQAVLKATKRMEQAGRIPAHAAPAKPAIYIKDSGENYLVYLQDILYCEAQKNYTKVFLTDNKSHSTLLSISKFEEELNAKSNDFIRIHRSFVVAKKHIASFGANFVMISDHKIPIGTQYKKVFFEQLNIGKK